MDSTCELEVELRMEKKCGEGKESRKFELSVSEEAACLLLRSSKQLESGKRDLGLPGIVIFKCKI